MKLLTLFVFAALAFGQTLTLTGPATLRPGAIVPVVLTLANPPANLAALQWTLTLPCGTVTAVAGAASNLAGKTLYCNASSTTCLTAGIGTNLYATGAVATYSWTVPAFAVPGRVAISLAGLVGATLAGDNAPLTGAEYNTLILARTDLNGDGKTDILDLQIMIQEILGGPAVNDQNGDGVANVRDAQIVARAVMVQ
jgi:hypothetical protein